MKKNYILSITAIAIISVLYSSCSTNTYMGRFVKWRASDIEDYKKFPKYSFAASVAPYYFTAGFERDLDHIKVSKKKGQKQPLLDILENSGTTAFIVLKNDTIIYEKYLNGYKRGSVNTSFSVAKSITSLVMAKAVDDRLINSADDLVIKYMPDLLQSDPMYSHLKISHLLNMKSGLQFKDHDLPWGDKAKAYYCPRLRQRIKELPIKNKPGSKFKYNPYNPILAGMILERTSGVSPAQYFEQKIWNRLGMEYAGSWSMDSKESSMTKMESGLNIRAIDLAKLARLVLYKGNWNGNQVISENQLNDLFEISSEDRVKDFGNEIYYKKYWWIYSPDGQHASIISGWGHLGQYLFIFPKEKTIIIRMGKKTGKIESWGTVFKEIVALIQ
ncbi:MAG TPA: class C beta-lactamase-related serine hydrolase [Bacteroidetes bacterium]|nr:class C beta-lactamase-related serine hydrolase [Bacteroidota bacterium]